MKVVKSKMEQVPLKEIHDRTSGIVKNKIKYCKRNDVSWHYSQTGGERDEKDEKEKPISKWLLLSKIVLQCTLSIQIDNILSKKISLQSNIYESELIKSVVKRICVV